MMLNIDTLYVSNNGSDANNGLSITTPLATVQTAIEKIIKHNAVNPGAKEYTIYVKDTVYAKAFDNGNDTTYKTADFSDLNNTALKVKIIGEGSDATLSAYASEIDKDNYAESTIKTAEKLELTLKNLTIIGGKDKSSISLAGCTLNIDGTLYIENKILIAKDCKAEIKSVNGNATIQRRSPVVDDTMLSVNENAELKLIGTQNGRLIFDGNTTKTDQKDSSLIYINENGTLNAKYCDFKNNYKYATYAINGVIGTEIGAAITLSNCKISNCGCYGNYAYGGGIIIKEGCSLKLIDTQIDCNATQTYGNGVLLEKNATLTLEGTVCKPNGEGLDVLAADGNLYNSTSFMPIILGSNFNSNSRIMLYLPDKELDTKTKFNTPFINMGSLEIDKTTLNKIFTVKNPEYDDATYTVTTEGKISPTP